jgi:exopolysaccharide biosynthesis protein
MIVLFLFVKLRRIGMNTQTSERTSFFRMKQRTKRFRFWGIFWISCLIILLAGYGFLYSTNQGLQFRKMLVGTVLTSQHPQYVKYMHFLLSQSEIDLLYKTMKNPKVNQSKIGYFTPALKDQGGTLNIQTNEIKNANFTAKILVIPDPTTVHLVVTKYEGKGQPLSELIQENNGVAGINAGGFFDKGGHGSGGQMIGIAISNGKVLSTTSGSNNEGKLIGGFLKDGQFITGRYSVNQLLKLGVTDAVQFGPQLIVDGKNVVSSSINAAWGWAPRTAIGQSKSGSIVMIITDGRFYWDKTHRGASMNDLVQLFNSYNITNAIAMDGGGSTTMIKDGKLLLKPATETAVGMRYLPNAWVVIPH